MFKLPVIVFACVTAYNATFEQCGSDAGITASGARVQEGVTVACDFAEFGDVIEIDGHRYIVQDRIGNGSDNHIDIYMDDENAAWEFGRQYKIVKVYKNERN